MKIEITWDWETDTYTLYYNGAVLLECLGADELAELTVGKIKELALSLSM